MLRRKQSKKTRVLWKQQATKPSHSFKDDLREMRIENLGKWKHLQIYTAMSDIDQGVKIIKELHTKF